MSLFPLPLDTLKRWVVAKNAHQETPPQLVHCSDLKVTDVWTATFPKLTSESVVRILDVNQDGVDDIIFGFGTGKYKIMLKYVFISIYIEYTS